MRQAQWDVLHGVLEPEVHEAVELEEHQWDEHEQQHRLRRRIRKQ